jgi:hypothetical protein
LRLPFKGIVVAGRENLIVSFNHRFVICSLS